MNRLELISNLKEIIKLLKDEDDDAAIAAIVELASSVEDDYDPDYESYDE
jgi:hypothetical protein